MLVDPPEIKALGLYNVYLYLIVYLFLSIVYLCLILVQNARAKSVFVCVFSMLNIEKMLRLSKQFVNRLLQMMAKCPCKISFCLCF